MSNRSDRRAVGIIGLGDMGHAIASRLIETDWRVVVHDIRPDVADDLVERGALLAESVADLAHRVGFIGIVVTTDAQVADVVRNVLAVAPDDIVLVVHSTVLPATAIAVAEAAASRGIAVLDAPVSGGSEKARAGTLTVMAGGEQDVFRRCAPLLETIARQVFHIGPTGAGSAAKLANNLLSQAGYALQLEAMQLAAAYGIDEDVMVSVAVASGGDSRGLRTWGRLDRLRRSHTLAGTHQMREFLAKDIAHAVVAAGQRNVILPIAAVAASVAPTHMERRDDALAKEPPPAVPLCSVCDQELAVPFRADGVHPECQPSS